MATKKKSRDRFADLIDEVQPLKPSSKRVPMVGPHQTASPILVTNSATGPALTVESIDGILVGHASDVPLSAAHGLRNGPLPPLRHLDLHRMSATKARSILQKRIQQARRDGIKSLIVIFGRGTHSGHIGPVLPDVVVEALSTSLAGHVLAFRSAPPQFGGTGALIVRLRRLT